MKVIKLFLVAFTVTLLITGCQSDDFCTSTPVTPSLVLRFYNKDNNAELKAVQRLSIIAQGKSDSLVTNVSVDSIAIPLNTLASETVYTLKKNEASGNKADNQTATLTIKYTTAEEFVSRACGFRVIFNNVSFESTAWIDKLSVSQLTTINSQNNAHINVFH